MNLAVKYINKQSFEYAKTHRVTGYLTGSIGEFAAARRRGGAVTLESKRYVSEKTNI